MIMGFVLLGAGRPVSPVPDLDRGRLVCPLRTALCDFNRVRRGVLATMLKSDMLVFLLGETPDHPLFPTVVRAGMPQKK